MICVRLMGRCGRAGCGRGARASVEASRPVAASGLWTRPLLDPWMLMLRTRGRRYICELFTRLRSHGIALSVRSSSAPKGRAAFSCTGSRLLQPISRQYFPVDRIAPRRGALQTAIGEATEGSHSNLYVTCLVIKVISQVSPYASAYSQPIQSAPRTAASPHSCAGDSGAS